MNSRCLTDEEIEDVVVLHSLNAHLHACSNCASRASNLRQLVVTLRDPARREARLAEIFLPSAREVHKFRTNTFRFAWAGLALAILIFASVHLTARTPFQRGSRSVDADMCLEEATLMSVDTGTRACLMHTSASQNFCQ